jgi:hypothetical protein
MIEKVSLLQVGLYLFDTALSNRSTGPAYYVDKCVSPYLTVAVLSLTDSNKTGPVLWTGRGL